MNRLNLRFRHEPEEDLRRDELVERLGEEMIQELARPYVGCPMFTKGRSTQ